MVIEESIHINASAEVLFNIYKDVARWNHWDPDTKASFLDGPFAVGTTGRLIPTKGHGVPMKVTALVPDRSFTVEASILLFHMKFEHELVRQGNGTRAVHRVSFSGALCFVLGRMVGRQVRKGLPITMGSLKAYAEAREAKADPAPCSDDSRPIDSPPYPGGAPG